MRKNFSQFLVLSTFSKAKNLVLQYIGHSRKKNRLSKTKQSDLLEIGYSFNSFLLKMLSSENVYHKGLKNFFTLLCFWTIFFIMLLTRLLGNSFLVVLETISSGQLLSDFKPLKQKFLKFLICAPFRQCQHNSRPLRKKKKKKRNRKHIILFQLNCH